MSPGSGRSPHVCVCGSDVNKARDAKAKDLSFKAKAKAKTIAFKANAKAGAKYRKKRNIKTMYCTTLHFMY